jgi:DNA-binding CsgD family transcriptional regulator
VIQCDENWLSVADTFHAAALGAGSWLDALSGLAGATGSRAGELIGLGSEHTVPFNWVAGIGQDWLEEFIAIGGGNPAINPFVRAGSQIPVLKVLASADFVTPEERRSGLFLADFCRRHDTPHICLSPLIKEGGMLVGLAVIRSASQGEIDARQRAVFTTLAPHMRAAVKTQMALEHQGALLVAGAMEALSMAVFVCDRLGTVKAMTPAAEALVSKGDALRLRSGRMKGAHAAETHRLTEAIDKAADVVIRPGGPRCSTVLMRGNAAQPLALDVVPLPKRDFAFGFEPRVLVMMRASESNAARTLLLLQSAYHLTAAEADVALRLSNGQRPENIAATRGVSLGTVRVQIRTIFTKLDVHRQSELVARVKHLQ